MSRESHFRGQKKSGSHFDAFARARSQTTLTRTLQAVPSTTTTTTGPTPPSSTTTTATSTVTAMHLCQNGQQHGTVTNDEGRPAAAATAIATPGGRLARVVRALQLWLPPQGAKAATATATAPWAAQAIAEDDFVKVEDSQARERGRAPRNALDFSGHFFTKTLQVCTFSM